jgi:hypothetical protein
VEKITSLISILAVSLVLIAPIYSSLNNVASHDLLFQEAYGNSLSEGSFHFFIAGVDKTGLHKFTGEAEGTTFFDTFVDTKGILRVNNTLTDSGIDAKIHNPETTFDYCCWNSTATVTENVNGTYTFTLYAYGDFTDLFPQYSAVYLTGLIGADRSTITNVVGITAFETGDGSTSLLTCDLRVQQDCYTENQNVGTADGTWQMRFTSDIDTESFVVGAFIETQNEHGAFILIHTGKAKVQTNNPFLGAGRYTVTVEIHFDYERDVKGNVELFPSGVVSLNKGKIDENSYELEWTNFYIESNELVYSAIFFDELKSNNNLLGELYGTVNLKDGLDFENKVDMKINHGNTMFVSILTDGIPEPDATVVFDTKKKSKAILEFVE